MKNKKLVLRTCAVSKEQFEKNELFRIVKDNTGKIFVDDSMKANGRGCYLKKDKEIIEKAKKGNILSYHLKAKIEDTVYEELLSKLK